MAAPVKILLDALAAVVRSEADVDVAVPSRWRVQVRRWLMHLGLGAPQCAYGWEPTDRLCDLTASWSRGDREAVARLLCAWDPLKTAALLPGPSTYSITTNRCARTLASLLGLGLTVGRRWYPGGRSPTTEEIRWVLSNAIPRTPPYALNWYDLHLDVFLRRLGMSPARVADSWSDLWQAGAFEGFEPRKGGTSSGRHTYRVARLEATGWWTEVVDLETCHGYRDLVRNAPIGGPFGGPYGQ